MRTGRALAAAAVFAAALFWWLAVVTHHGGLDGLDESIRTQVHALAMPWLRTSAEVLTWLGAPGVLALFSGVATLILFRAGRRSDAVLLLVVMAGSIVLENGLKFAIQRPRPTPFIGTNPDTYSFPSGHALFSFCFYGTLATVLGRTGAGAIAWPAAGVLVAVIGGTRIYLGVHYPTDVIAGYLAAAAWFCAVLAAKPRWREARRAGRSYHPEAEAPKDD